MSNSRDEPHPADGVDVPDRFILPSLIVSASVAWIPGFLAGILLVDIGQTFGHPVGVVGQMFTVSRIVGVASALVLGALSVRFRHRTLLMVGLLCFLASSIGCSLAPNFTLMLISYSLSGLGMTVVMPMTFALVGEYLPLEKRASAIGWISVSTAVSGIIGGPIVGLIVGYDGWRLAFLVFVLPLSLLGLLGAARWLPSEAHGEDSEASAGDFLEGFKEVFSNRSAVACLLAWTLALASFTAIGAYAPSYLRERFSTSTAFVSLTMAGMNLCYSLGSIVSGRLVDRFGRRPLLVSSLLITGLLIVSSTNTGNLWPSMAIILTTYALAGLIFPVSNGLTLEQVPRFRGTMMSLNSAAESTGIALGSGLGGLVLLMYDYELVGTSLGALGVVAAFIYRSLVVDPTENQR